MTKAANDGIDLGVLRELLTEAGNHPPSGSAHA